MEHELYHAGVKGMKWGVRNDKNKTGSPARKNRDTSGTTVTKTVQRGNTTKITSKVGNQKAKLTVKRDRGAKLVAKHNNVKVKVILSNTANVAAGALRVAAAFIPGAGALTGVANAAALVSTVANVALK